MLLPAEGFVKPISDLGWPILDGDFGEHGVGVVEGFFKSLYFLTESFGFGTGLLPVLASGHGVSSFET